jgi:O-antigen/teichoic acid export membrane protein
MPRMCMDVAIIFRLRASSANGSRNVKMNIYTYLTLKASNTVFQLAFGILTTYVFLRTLSPDVFAAYILISAIGAYSSLADLGCSNLIYVSMRKAYLNGEHLGTALEEALAALFTFGAVVLLVLFVVGALILANVIDNHGRPLNLILYLLFWLLLLPWNIVRTTANAVDLYVPFEVLELTRHLLVTAFLIALLARLEVREYLIAVNVVWGACFIIAAFYGRRLLDEFGAGKGSIAAAVVRLYRDRLASVKAVAAFNVSAFTIYVFPYFIIPAMSFPRDALVVFDTFYKVGRFGATAYRVAADAFLPMQTRAVHEGRTRDLMSSVGMVLAFQFVIFLVGAICLLAGSDWIFPVLLNGKVEISQAIVLMMVAMLFLELFQLTLEIILINSGLFEPMAKLYVTVVTALGTVALVSYLWELSFPLFLGMYVLVYGLGAILHVPLFLHYFGRQNRVSQTD